MRPTTALVLGFALFAGCATAKPPKSGFLGDYAAKLAPTPGPDNRWRWQKPGVDFTRYDKFMVEYVVFALADDSKYKGIDGEQMKELGDAASLALVKAISAKYPVVSEPGPDVLRIRVAIVGLKQSQPVISAITTVVPAGIGISVIKKGTTGSWSGSGATEAEVMMIDSMTNEVVGVGYDEYKAGFTERYTKWGSIEDAFQYWGTRGVSMLDRMRAEKAQRKESL